MENDQAYEAELDIVLSDDVDVSDPQLQKAVENLETALDKSEIECEVHVRKMAELKYKLKDVTQKFNLDYLSHRDPSQPKPINDD